MPVSLSAEQDSRVLLWSREQLLPILLNKGAALWELCQLLIWRVRRASDVLEELAFHPVAGRLAKFLVDQYGKSGEERIKRELTLDEMAAHIGSTREMVCRILQRFSTQGLIEITRTEFTFTNWDHLAKLAQTDVKEH
jgi:CRP-like cAMP-binding protein